MSVTIAEQAIPGVEASLVVDAAIRHGHRHVRHCPDWHDVPATLEPEVRAGDVILTLGAGDIYKLSELMVGEDAS